ncbi:MAG: hypothetical protein ACK559_28375 [bacterium]
MYAQRVHIEGMCPQIIHSRAVSFARDFIIELGVTLRRTHECAIPSPSGFELQRTLGNPELFAVGKSRPRVA